MARAPVTPRQAGTVVLLREASAGPEVLMLRRPAGADFAADAWVFPGGAVDAADRRLPSERWRGIDPVAMAPGLGVPPEDVLGYHVAAVRETFEEAGILLGVREDGRAADLGGEAAEAARELLRADGAAGAGRDADAGQAAGGAGAGWTWAGWLEAERLVLELGALVPYARWVTPAQAPKRFDACFFLARAPQGQAAARDEAETTDGRWLTPAEALDRAAGGEMLLWYPTEQTLRALAAIDSVEAALAHARAIEAVPRVQPHLERGPAGPRLVHPDEPDYPHERYGPRGDLAEPGASAPLPGAPAPSPGVRR